METTATFKVTLIHGDRTPVVFDAKPGRSIAKSAQVAGYPLTTGCLQGRCAICRARLVSGEVAAIRRASRNAVGDPVNRADGCVLPCSIGPCSDVVLEPLSPWIETTSC